MLRMPWAIMLGLPLLFPHNPGSAVDPGLCVGCVVEAAGPSERSGPENGYPESDYYTFVLLPTQSIPGSSAMSGEVSLDFGTSPFGVTTAADGSYRYEVHVSVQDRPRAEGEWVAWVARNDLQATARLGALDEYGRAHGTVEWNKFMVVISLEQEASEEAVRWSGPIVMRGLARSGLLHTKGGHAPFQQPLCMALDFGACRR